MPESRRNPISDFYNHDNKEKGKGRKNKIKTKVDKSPVIQPESFEDLNDPNIDVEMEDAETHENTEIHEQIEQDEEDMFDDTDLLDNNKNNGVPNSNGRHLSPERNTEQSKDDIILQLQQQLDKLTKKHKKSSQNAKKRGRPTVNKEQNGKPDVIDEDVDSNFLRSKHGNHYANFVEKEADASDIIDNEESSEVDEENNENNSNNDDVLQREAKRRNLIDDLKS